MDAALRELIIKAFEKAKSSGKPDWHRMTTAVLKNRLIQLTQGAFRESDYGLKSINELVGQAPDFLAFDKTQSGLIVELVAEQAVQQAPAPDHLGYERIRPDLWQAIMDYSSGNQYVWDSNKNVARLRTASDPAECLMPTIDADTDAAWRKAFEGKVAGEVSEFAQGKLRAFVEHGVSPRVLPHAILTKWNEYLKSQILERLSEWFKDRNITPPERLVVSSVRRPPKVTQEGEVEQLRALIVACVKGMTPQELASVTLPPLALLRGRKDKNGA